MSGIEETTNRYSQPPPSIKRPPSSPTSVVPHSFPSSKFTYDSPDFYVPYSNFNYAADLYSRYMYDTGYDPTLLSFPSLYGPRTAASPPPPPRTAEIPLENKTPARWPNVTNEILMRAQQSIEGTVDFDGQDLATLEQEARDSYYGTMPIWHLSGLPAPLRKGVSPRPLSNLAVSFENLTPSAWPKTVSEYMLDTVRTLPNRTQVAGSATELALLVGVPFVAINYGLPLAAYSLGYTAGVLPYYAGSVGMPSLISIPDFSSIAWSSIATWSNLAKFTVAGGVYVASEEILERYQPIGKAVSIQYDWIPYTAAAVRGGVVGFWIWLQLTNPYYSALTSILSSGALSIAWLIYDVSKEIQFSRAAILAAVSAMASPLAAFMTLIAFFGEWAFYHGEEHIPERFKDPLGKLGKMGAEAAAAAAAAIREAAAAIAGAMGSVGAGLQSTIQQYLYYLLAALGVYVGYKVLTA